MAFRFPSSGLYQSKPNGIGGFSNGRGSYIVSRVLSTSVETRVNENSFERIYVQANNGGMNVKPLVVERIDKDENMVGEEGSSIEVESGGDVNLTNLEGLIEPKVVEESEVEKEAWRLLREAVVYYCGSPVGTVAANDPGDKQPLNYDQVFIRDFVPSALAFLLKGEGEIVRNFLLHTLQLQVNNSNNKLFEFLFLNRFIDWCCFLYIVSTVLLLNVCLCFGT